MLRNCENRRCGQLFDDDGRPGQFWCGPECRAARHAQLLRTPCSDEPAPAPAAWSKPPTLAPAKRATTVREAYLTLSDAVRSPDESRRLNAERENDMLIAAALGPRRPI